MKKILAIVFVLCVGIALAAPIRSLLASRGGEYTEEEELVIVPVEYIESTGTQWIDLGIVLDTEIEFSIDFQPTIRQSWERYVLGGRKIRFMYYYGYRIYIYINSNTALGDMINTAALARGTFKKEGDTYTYGRQTYTYEGDYVADNTTASLPARNGQNNSGLAVRLFSAQIGDLDLIPVRFTNSHGEDEGAMYDLATDKLFRNQGTGSFIIGPDL